MHLDFFFFKIEWKLTMCFMQMEEEKGKEMIEKINDKERKKIKCFPCICLEVGRRMEKTKKQEIVHFLFVLFEKQRNGMFF